MEAQRLVVGISGASGVVYGIRLLEALRNKVETHLVLSDHAKQIIRLETDRSVEQVASSAVVVHRDDDLASPLASGSFKTAGMVISPCSIKTLSAVANCYSSTLIARAADVTPKERRPLILVVRETPLHLGHLRLMVRVAEMGAVVLPPMPAFYHGPKTIADLVDHTVGKIMDLLRIQHELWVSWGTG